MNEYQESLKNKMNSLVHSIYRVAKTFPKDEIFGTTSQLKRASLSIILNYISPRRSLPLGDSGYK